jgi:hypothetical protein
VSDIKLVNYGELDWTHQHKQETQVQVFTTLTDHSIILGAIMGGVPQVPAQPQVQQTHRQEV